MKVNEINLDFAHKVLVIHKEVDDVNSVTVSLLEVKLEGSSLSVPEQVHIKECLNGFKNLISDTLGLIYVARHEIDTGSEGPVLFQKHIGMTRLNKRL